MKPTEIERLRQFLGAYFHQDWTEDDPDADGVITRFISDHQNREELASLAALVDAYAAGRDDSELEQSLVTELLCQYLPSADGVRARDWLQHVVHRLRTAAGS